MADKADPIEKKASREATDWSILLKDDAENEELRRDFEAWLAHSSVNASAWRALQQASQAMDTATPVFSDRWKPFLAEARGEASSSGEDVSRWKSKRALQSTPGLRSPSVRHKRRRSALRLGGIAVAASLLAVLAGPDLLLDLRADYTTGKAEIRTIDLPDDSRITLAPESALDIAYTPGERGIRLLAGEAFFEVAPNGERPFRAAADSIEVTVLATGFGLRRSEDGAEVAVEHGRVRVDHADVSTPFAETLTAGEAVQVGWAGGAERSDAPIDQIAAWRRSQLVARDEPFGAVVDELRRYYGGRIILMDEELARRPVTGVYNLADPVAALRAIARAQNAVVQRITPWLIVVTAS